MRVVTAAGAGLIAVALGGCSFFTSANSSQSAVIAQATPGGQVAYDVVKVDDAVVRTVLSHTPQPFHERFNAYRPPPEAKIAVGDVVSVVIWESSPEGLFGYSLWETIDPRGLPLAQAYGSLSELANPSTGSLSPAVGNPSTGIGQGLSLTGDNPTTAAEQALLPISAAQSGVQMGPQTSGVAAAAAASAPSSIGGVSSDLAAAALTGALSTTSANPTNPATGIQQPNASGLAASAAGTQATAPSAAQALQVLAGAASGLPQLPLSLERLAQSGRPGTRVPLQQVGTDGGITVPYAGRITVAGRTPHEVERIIDERLGGKAVDPQALVTVLLSPANTVTVAGEVIGGKRVPLNPGGEHLLDVIAAAGGADAPVHDTFIQLSRDGVTATVSMDRVVEHPEENIFARPGDVLTLIKRPQTFSVFGATGKNAAITFDRDRLSLSEALAKSGGLLDDQADPRAVFLFRYEPDSVVQALGQPLATDAPKGVSPVAYRFDLKDAKTYLLAKEFPVRDKDIVFVANAEIQPVYRFFSVLQNVTGPVVTGFLVCQNATC